MRRMTLGIKAGAGKMMMLAILALGGGCSHFDQEWNAAANRPETGGEGRWQGKWVSDVDGHSGELRCVLRRQGPNTYLASFNGTFWQVLSFSYDSPLHGYTNDGEFELAGRQDLCLPEGSFFYDGHVNNERFFLTYRAKYDGGHAVMSRP